MVEDICKDFLNQEMPENYSPVYHGGGVWEYTNGGCISACVDTKVLPQQDFFPYPWRYKAEIWLGRYEYEEKVFNRFIDEHQWLGELRK